MGSPFSGRPADGVHRRIARLTPPSHPGRGACQDADRAGDETLGVCNLCEAICGLELTIEGVGPEAG